MPLIQSATIARKLMQSLRLTALPDSILAPETVAVILVEDLSAPLSDENRGCMGSVALGPVAAENSFVTLERVGDSYALDVTEVHFGVTTSQNVLVAAATTALTGITASANKQFENFSLPGQPTSLLGSDTAVGLPASRNLYRGPVLANTIYRIPLNIRIGGDEEGVFGLFVGAETVNTVLFAGFKWTESAPLG